MTLSEAARRSGELRTRYTTSDVAALGEPEARRFLPAGRGDPQAEVTLAWELLYRIEPELYDRLATAERLHPEVLEWLPGRLGRVVEVGAGTGRLTTELAQRARELVAVEPAAPLREILSSKLESIPEGACVQVTDGFFDRLPARDGWADLVIACSAFTPAPGHGGETGLGEMERVCKPGGSVVIVWPNNVPWLKGHGFRHLSFPGEACAEFASSKDAAELIEIFYPHASPSARDGRLRIPYRELGVNAPCDLAFKVLAA